VHVSSNYTDIRAKSFKVTIHQPWLNDSHPFNNSRVGDEYLLNLKMPDIQYALITADVAMKKEKLLVFPCFIYRTVS
jgi:hypothetical protein